MWRDIPDNIPQVTQEERLYHVSMGQVVDVPVPMTQARYVHVQMISQELVTTTTTLSRLSTFQGVVHRKGKATCRWSKHMAGITTYALNKFSTPLCR